MYLLLVDRSFISNAEFQELVDHTLPESDLVKCYSTGALLRVAEKLTPELIIVDLELIDVDLAGFFESLREKCPDSQVLVLIEPDSHEKLYTPIVIGGVDDYMVKPFAKDDFRVRVHLAARKKKTTARKVRQPAAEPVGYADGAYYETAETEADGDHESEEDKYYKPADEDLLRGGFPLVSGVEDDLEKAGEYESAAPAEEGAMEGTVLAEPFGLEPDEYSGEEAGEEGVEAPPSEFFDLEETEEPESGDQGAGDPAAPQDYEFEQHGDNGFERYFSPGDGFDKTDVGREDQGGETGLATDGFSLTKEQSAREPVDPFGGDFGDSPPKAEEAEKTGSGFFEPGEYNAGSEGGEFESIFDDDSPGAGEKDSGPAFEPFEDSFSRETQKGDDFKESFKGEPFETQPFEKEWPRTQAGGDSFFDEQGPEKGFAPAETGDDQYFSDLFDDMEEPGSQPPKPDVPAMKTGWGAAHAEPGPSTKEVRIHSTLPGRSADEFLFGEDSPEGEDFNRAMLDDFTGEDDEEAEDDQQRGRGKKQNPPKSGGAKALSIIGNIVFVVILLVMATLSFFLIQSRISGGVPQVAGYQMYIVLSGSMYPEFDTGSLAFVREIEPEQIVVGDIITFRPRADSDTLTTHRVVEVSREEGLQFITRGDANNVNDPSPVLAENVVGYVTGSIPYLGYLMNFVQTRQGLILLIFVPGVLIIVYELSKIMKYLTQGENGRSAKRGGKRSRLAEE